MLPPALDPTSVYFSGMHVRSGTEHLVAAFEAHLRPLVGEAGVNWTGKTWLPDFETRWIQLRDIRTLSHRLDQKTNLWAGDPGSIPGTLTDGLDLFRSGIEAGFADGQPAISFLPTLDLYWFDNDDGAHRIGAGRATILRHRPNYVIEARLRTYVPSPTLLAILDHCEIVVTLMPSDAQFSAYVAWVADTLRGDAVCAPV